MATSNSLIACLLVVLTLALLPTPAAAFGAGNVPSISKIENKAFLHGDVEDFLKTIAFLKGKKWTSLLIKRVYFGNWLRDYSQALDVGTLKSVQADSIRVLVWVLAFLSFGYATQEFEVTADRLGVYRPEEHIDNPKHYNDDKDAREFDPRLRGPPREAELAVDPRTGMKNYIANEQGDWATSIGYVRQSLLRSIHFGRMYTSSQKSSGSPEDLYEALRCLGQSLHCLEDFGAHTNYTELTLRQLGMNEVFPHTGLATEINLRGQRTFPLVTGTFGTVDFIHSVLGTATDHFAQTEVQQLDRALGEAQAETNRENLDGQRGFGISGTNMSSLTGLLSQIPGSGGNLCRQAEHLQFEADKQDSFNSGSQAIQERGGYQAPRASGPNFSQGGPSANIPGTNVDPVALAKKIYPILEFRDNVVRAIALTIERVPGLEKLVQKIMETLQLFILSLLAPFVRPIINAVSATLKQGSSTLVDTSAKHQFEVWTNISCSDPTHSMLSKDHFSNVLNEPAGFVAAEIVKYVAPRIVYAWEHPGVPEQEVMQDILRVFHHPVLRDQNCELHRNMFDAVQLWLSRNPDRSKLADILSSEGVRKGKNDIQSTPTFSHGSLSASNMFGFSGYTQVPAQQWHKISGRSIADGAPAGDDIGLGNAYPSGLEPGHAAMAGRQSSDFGAGSSGEVAGYCRAESEAARPSSSHSTHSTFDYGVDAPPTFGYEAGPVDTVYEEGPPPPPPHFAYGSGAHTLPQYQAGAGVGSQEYPSVGDAGGYQGPELGKYGD